MKIKHSGAAALLAFALLASCDQPEPQPVETPVVLPLRLEQLDFTRTLEFDAGKRLSRVKNVHIMLNDVVLESTTEFFYSADGRMEKTLTDNGYRLEFVWKDGRIIRTNEYLNEQFSQYHTFSYDEKGRVEEWITWQDIPEEGGVIPKSKEMYLYDARNNLTEQFLYFYNPGIDGHELLSAFEFSEYDDQPEAESLFDGYAFNPMAVFRQNNPGKMIVKNRLGNTSMIDRYTYVYDTRGYATRKTTTSLFSHSGSGGSYDTHYYYETR